MKRSFLFLALAAAYSCSTPEVQTPNESNNDTQAHEITIEATTSDTESRVELAHGQNNIWLVKWEKGDAMGGWSDLSKTSYTKFEMATFGEKKSTFKGTASGNLRLVYPYMESTVIDGDCLEVDYASQSYDPVVEIESLNDNTYMISEKSVSSDSAISVPMKHIGAAMEVVMMFEGLDPNYDYTIKSIALGSDESGYVKTPTFAKVDLAKDGIAFIQGSPVYGPYNVEVSNSAVIAEGTQYAVGFYIHQFFVQAGEKVKLSVTLSKNDSSEVTKTFDIVNGTDAEIKFVRGAHHWLTKLCDMEDSAPAVDIPAEATALLGMKSTLGGSLDWSAATYPTWEGVTFDAEDRVTSIELAAKGLTGSIPDFSAFTELTTLDLSNNDLTGNIPATIGSLANLTTFKVSMNKLAGIVPCDVINENYPQWDAMTNVYPQQGSDDTSTPSKLKLKLNDYGMLRVMYWTMDGPNWDWSGNYDGSLTEPEWLHAQPELIKSTNDPATQKVHVGIIRVSNTGNVQSFGEISNVKGSLPEEVTMVTAFAQLRLSNGVISGVKISGNEVTSLPKAFLAQAKYILLNENKLNMSIDDIINYTSNDIMEIQLKKNLLYGANGIPESITTKTKLGKNFNISLNADLSGEISLTVKEYLMTKLGDTDGSKFKAQITNGTGLTVAE